MTYIEQYAAELQGFEHLKFGADFTVVGFQSFRVLH